MSRASDVSVPVRAIFILSICLLVWLVLSTPPRISAQGVQDFRFSDFVVDYKLTNDDPQGTLEITETMLLEFSGQNRGILRTIPETYKGNNLNMVVLDVQRDGMPETYITYSENGNTIIKIGSPDIYITGQHSYAVSYRVENVITFYDDYDELFWDVNGDQWLQTFDSVSAQLVHGATTKKLNPAICYTGSFGSADSNCTVVEDINRTNVQTTSALNSAETLTIVQAFEKGYFTPPTWLEENWRLLFAAPIGLMQLALVRSAHKKWQRYGKDPKRRVTAPFYGRPKGVSVMQADYVAKNSLSQKAVSASIIDLAIRGYIQINERKVGRSTKHDLVLKNDNYSDLAEDEQILIRGLFTGVESGAVVELESKKRKMFNVYKEITTKVDKLVVQKNLYETSPKKPGKRIRKEVLFGLVLGYVGFRSAGLTSGISLIAVPGAAALLVYAGVMSKRTQSGTELVEHMDGLKLYLGMAEKDRIAQQDAVEAPLAPYSGQPTRDVKFFEKLLPFAIAMGVENTWAEAFSDIYKQAPEWYGGNWSTFSTVVLASSLSKTAAAAGQSFSAPSSSSGSGFGGGAGGGGGGGGGGGW